MTDHRPAPRTPDGPPRSPGGSAGAEVAAADGAPAAPVWSSAEGPWDDLDALAPELLTRGLPARLADRLDELLAADLGDHPWSQLVAAAVSHDAHRGDPRAEVLAAAAWATFAETADVDGMAVAANVRANLALGRGDVSEAVRWWRRAAELSGERVPVPEATLTAHSSLDAYHRGDLCGALATAEEALAAAEDSEVPGEAIVALIYLTLYAFTIGDFERARASVGAAAALELSVEPARNEGALVLGFQGVVEAVRGDAAASERLFAAALERAVADDVPWYELMVRGLRAQFTAAWAPERSLDDARRASAAASAVGDRWWEGLARMAEGWALCEVGELEEADAVLADAVRRLENPTERAFALLQQGEVRLRAGRRAEARECLDDAREAFDASGARYWAARAYLRTGAADRDRSGRWFAVAREAAEGDPVYERLFVPDRGLRIEVAGRPEVVIGGEPAQFITRHAELSVYLCALAGPRGLPTDELAAVLWPGVSEHRTGPRLRTLLWQVRNTLGVEAWRVQRDGDRVVLDLTGVALDLDPSRGGLLDGWDVDLPPSVLAALGRPWVDAS